MQSLDSSRHVPWLDGWRGVALALVLLDHFAGTSTGRLGVEVFFVLSGLLITRILFEQKVPLATFYRRRAARILPVFYLYVVTMVTAGLLFLPSVDWASVASTAVFARSYVGSHIWDDPLAFGNLWSLNVEEHAYLFLSLLAFVAARRSERAARWLLSLALLMPLSAHAYFRVFPEATGITPFYLRTEAAIFPLLVSAATFMWARVYRIRISQTVAAGLLAMTIVTIAIDAVGVARGGNAIRYVLLPVLLALSVNVLDRMPALVLKALSVRWLMWLGKCSFSIYLWHYPFFVLIHNGTWPFGNIAALACAFAVGIASFYYFEEPMRALLRGYKRKVPRPAAAPQFEYLRVDDR